MLFQETKLGTAHLSESDLEQKSRKIQALLRAGKFNEAEPLARECIQQLPEEIYFLGQLEMVLNGQGKFREAAAEFRYNGGWDTTGEMFR